MYVFRRPSAPGLTCRRCLPVEWFNVACTNGVRERGLALPSSTIILDSRHGEVRCHFYLARVLTSKIAGAMENQSLARCCLPTVGVNNVFHRP